MKNTADGNSDLNMVLKYYQIIAYGIKGDVTDAKDGG